MKLSAFALVLLACASAVPQAKTQTTLLEALHCIRSGDQNWLNSPLDTREMLLAAFTHDSESYPGETHLIVVVYENGSHGQFFDLKQKTNGTKHAFDIENNGAFTLKGNKLEFTNPPLGGVWTQNYLERGIRKAVRQPRTSFPLQAVVKDRTDLTCKSYLAKR